ncbi:hypothetical protein TCAP_04757, partial [Tolypocladium capitatum]
KRSPSPSRRCSAQLCSLPAPSTAPRWQYLFLTHTVAVWAWLCGRFPCAPSPVVDDGALVSSASVSVFMQPEPTQHRVVVSLNTLLRDPGSQQHSIASLLICPTRRAACQCIPAWPSLATRTINRGYHGL